MRLSYIDWMRGLACVLMFQTHCYDSWLSPEARKSTFFMCSQLGGTLPALLFRLQEFLIAWGWAPRSDLFRVDILNTIGVSMMLMAIVCWTVLGRWRAEDWLPFSGSAIAVALGIALLTPPLWTSWRPAWLPWPVESYLNGVHNLGVPQSWLFPIFPWSGFAFGGLA